MPRCDEAFVDRFLAPWNRHDVDGALALMTDDCVWKVTRGSEPHGTLFEGPSAVCLAIAGAFEVLPDIRRSTAPGSIWRSPNSAFYRRNASTGAFRTRKASLARSPHGRRAGTSTTRRQTGNSRTTMPGSNSGTSTRHFS
jgi:hypothetical protein